MSKSDSQPGWPHLNLPVTGSSLPSDARTRPVWSGRRPVELTESLHYGTGMDAVDRSDWPEASGEPVAPTGPTNQRHPAAQAVDPQLPRKRMSSGISSHGSGR